MTTATIAQTRLAQGESTVPACPLLAPGTPVLWREPDVLQVGFALAIPHAPRGAKTALSLLDGSHTVAGAAAAARVDPAWLHRCVRALEAARLLSSAAGGCVAVVGSGALADAASQAMGSLTVLRTEGPWPVRPVAALLVSDALTADRSLARRLTRGAIPHLFAGAAPGGAVVGPFVLPGHSACQRCTDLSLAGRDDAWPQLAAQLDAETFDADAAHTLWAAGLAAAHLRVFASGGAPESIDRSWELVNGELRVRRWTMHPECECGASVA